MAKPVIKKSFALLMAALLLFSSHSQPASAEGAASTVANLLDPKESLLSGRPDAAALQSAASEPLPGEGDTVVDPAIDTSSSKEVNVIVQLSGQPVSAARYSAGALSRSFSAQSAEQSVQREQSSFLGSVQSLGIPMEVNYRYDNVLNGMEVTIKANQIPKLALIAGVKSISPNSVYYPIPVEESPVYGTDVTTVANMDINPLKQIGADLAWEQGLTGKGLKVGVIDTGVDYTHPDLIDAYKGGYDSFYHDKDPYEEPPDPSFGYEGTQHGTHVSGTIVGRAKNDTSDFVQKGVAYEADLYVYKVLGMTYNEQTFTYQTSGTSAQVIDGIERAVKDGMDVINLSLGSDMAKNPDSPDSIAVNNAVLSGVVAVVANGNAGDQGKYYYSMGSPASAQLGISVAAATSDSTHYSGSFSASVAEAAYTPPVEEGSTTAITVTEDAYAPSEPEENYPISAMAWSLGETDFGGMLGDEPSELVYVGLGDSSDYSEAGDVTGKIVLISRGNLAFVDKIAIAKESGAKAAIIFNGNSLNGTGEADLSEHIPGRDGPIGPSGFIGENYGFLPVFDMAGYEGRALAREILNHPGKPVQAAFDPNFEETSVPGDTIASFSSRGPNSDGNYGIKPDIATPGVNILSTWPAYGALEPDASYDQAYYRISGTSMAAPHVAGLALLLKQKHPDWSPRDIRAALANTADILSDETGTQYDVYSQGAGRANVADALATPALVQSLDPVTIYDNKMNERILESEASSLSFGAIEPGAEPLSKPLRLKNTSDEVLTYTASVVMHPVVTSDPNDPIATPDVNDIVVTLGGLNADAGTITAAGDSSRTFTLSASAAGDAAHGVYEGEVKLESPGHPSLHLPFAIHVGNDAADNDFGIQEAVATSGKISPDAPIDVSATLTSDRMHQVLLEYYDLNENYIGRAADWMDLDPESQTPNPLPAGRFTFEKIDGSYANGDVDEYGKQVVKQLPEGLYKLVIGALHYNEQWQVDEVHSAELSVYFQPYANGGDPEDPDDGGSGGGSGGGGGGGAGTEEPVTEPAAASELLSAVTQTGQKAFPVAGKLSSQGDAALVSVTDDGLRAALDAANGSPAVFAVDVSATASANGKARLLLTPEQTDLLRSAPARSSIAFAWNGASVALPISALTALDAGSGLALDIASEAGTEAVFADSYPDAKLVGTPYSFAGFAADGGTEAPLRLAPGEAVSRAFLLKERIDASRTGALYADGNHAYPVPARFAETKDGDTIVTVTRPGFSTYAAATRDVSFDDIQTSWAKSEIETLARKFLLNGTSASAFSPKSPVTRAQFAAMLANAIGLGKDAAEAPFSDVAAEAWYAKDVAAAYEAGLVKGNEGKFMPNAPITRQDLTVMLARAMTLLGIQVPETGPVKPYTDASAFGAYAQESIQAVTGVGLMQGIEQQGQYYFDPASPTTREAAAKVLYQLLAAAKRI